MSESTHYPYTIVLRGSEQEQIYRAEVPAIPGCEGSGHSYEAALASAHRNALSTIQGREGKVTSKQRQPGTVRTS